MVAVLWYSTLLSHWAADNSLTHPPAHHGGLQRAISSLRLSLPLVTLALLCWVLQASLLLLLLPLHFPLTSDFSFVISAPPTFYPTSSELDTFFPLLLRPNQLTTPC